MCMTSEISHHRLLEHPVWLLQPCVLSAFQEAKKYKPGCPVDPVDLQGATGSVYPTPTHLPAPPLGAAPVPHKGCATAGRWERFQQGITEWSTEQG